MHTAPPAYGISGNDRLGVSAFGSLLLHMIVILGVGFTVPKLRALDNLTTLEITLVQSRSERAPVKPEFLAQANQDGGGDSDKPDIARNPLPVREVADSHRRVPTLRAPPQPHAASKQEAMALLSQPSERKIKVPERQPEKKDIETRPPEIGLPVPPELDERARLNAEISRVWQEYQKRPKRKFVNARTQEYQYAIYLAAWQAKIERVGNLNYPDEAKKRGIRGRLRLHVALNADGTINEVSVTQSSGHKLLDDAAVRIVQLSAPFSPFPAEMRAETDILDITRTWLFNDTLSSGEY